MSADRPSLSPEGPEYLKAPAVAAMLQVDESTVFRLAKKDPTMPMLRLSDGVVRFPRARLLAWLRAREQGPGKARIRSPMPSKGQAADFAGASDARNGAVRQLMRHPSPKAGPSAPSPGSAGVAAASAPTSASPSTAGRRRKQRQVTENRVDVETGLRSREGAREDGASHG